MAKEQKPAATPAPKKGNSSWRPAARLQINNKDPNFRYRWVAKESDNMNRKRLEGWVPANKINGGGGAEHQPTGLVQDGKPLDGNTDYRESLLMVMPEETARERDAYYSDETAKQTLGLKSMADAMNEKNAKDSGVGARPLHGNITLQRGTTVID